MKKQTIVKILLILLPVLAVGLATTVDSVTVFDTVTAKTEYYSYFDAIPMGNFQMLLPLAASLCVVSGVLAALWLGKKKPGFLKASGYIAFIAAAAASIPIAIRGDVLVIPNVGLPIFMLVHFGIARYAEKLPVEAKEKKAPRLSARR